MTDPITPLTTAPVPEVTTVSLADGGTLTISEPAAAPTASAALDVWFQAHIPNSAVSRNTGAYNTVLGAVNQIKAALAIVKE